LWKIIAVVLMTLLADRLNSLVNNYTFNLVRDYQLQTASFVIEIVLIREGSLELSNRVSLSRLELDQLVHVMS